MLCSRHTFFLWPYMVSCGTLQWNFSHKIMLLHLKVPYYRALPLSSNVLALIGLCIDFPNGSGVNHAHDGKSVNIRGIQSKLEEFESRSSSALPNKIFFIVQYYFWVNCIGYLFMLQNIFSYMTDALKDSPNLQMFMKRVTTVGCRCKSQKS